MPRIFREIRENLRARTAGPSAPPDFLLRVAASVGQRVVLFRENHMSGGGESGEVGNPAKPRDLRCVLTFSQISLPVTLVVEMAEIDVIQHPDGYDREGEDLGAGF
jgi:hypothetical protein